MANRRVLHTTTKNLCTKRNPSQPMVWFNGPFTRAQSGISPGNAPLFALSAVFFCRVMFGERKISPFVSITEFCNAAISSVATSNVNHQGALVVSVGFSNSAQNKISFDGVMRVTFRRRQQDSTIVPLSGTWHLNHLAEHSASLWIFVGEVSEVLFGVCNIQTRNETRQVRS